MIVSSGLSSIQLLTLFVSVVLPAVVALVTKRLASPGLKATVLFALAAVVGFLSELLDSLIAALPFDVGAAVMAWVTAFIVAVASHYGLLKPTGLTGSQGTIALKVSGGIGSEQPAARGFISR